MKKENAKEFKGVNELEIGKDYVSVLYSKFIVIDRVGDFNNEAIYDDLYRKEVPCANCRTWIEATEEEVIEAFERHLIHRYGEDWRTMKIKEKHPDATSYLDINDGSWCMEISKHSNGWNVWNNNGLLYRNGIWVERLEEEEINIKVSETQIGGSHYSEMAIQPIEFIHKNNLSFIQGNVIKYVCRYKSKGGIEDLQKAKHYIDLLIELEEENN